jgi:cytochrome c-type biogenesis protein CcmH/NrfG
MTRTSKQMLRLTLATAAGFAVLLATEKMPPTYPDVLVSTADARIGRPLTPLSYAGVARRTARRGAYAAGAAAAGAAAAGAYYGSGCYQAVDAYGRVYTRCP